MKKQIHPEYNTKSQVLCNSCKTLYTFGSTVAEGNVEVCANCHPFYTGKQNTLVDTDDRIKKYKEQLAKIDTNQVVKKRKKVAARKSKTTQVGSGPKLTLHDMLKQASK